jgi:hypothetical protein
VELWDNQLFPENHQNGTFTMEKVELSKVSIQQNTTLTNRENIE